MSEPGSEKKAKRPGSPKETRDLVTLEIRNARRILAAAGDEVSAETRAQLHLQQATVYALIAVADALENR